MGYDRNYWGGDFHMKLAHINKGAEHGDVGAAHGTPQHVLMGLEAMFEVMGEGDTLVITIDCKKPMEPFSEVQ